MTEIDWSKAPNGTTHWDANPNRVGSFMRLERGNWFFWPVGETLETRWHPWNREGKNDLTGLVPRPAPWNGEGLPPVGIVCEWKEKIGFQWVPATILFITESSVVCQRADGFEWQMLTKRTVFRPIRTAEQIAALYNAGARMPGEGSEA